MASHQSAPPQTINLRPDLALVVSQLHQSPTARLAQQALSAQDLDAQAVATAVTISKGSNFTVLKKKTSPKYLPKWRPTFQPHGAAVTAGRQPLWSETPPREILYKVPDVELDEQGHAIPEKRAQLAGLLIETLVLLHEPIDRHPFLPRLWGLTWTYNHVNPVDRIPVLVMHVADHGSLADFQSLQEKPLPIDEKRKICWQVGVAIEFLHKCGIKHGDIKSENVLIYKHPDGGILAKLTDFGFASISDVGSFKFLPPGSILWASPEARWSSEGQIDLKTADTYSYGLMVWRVFCDGKDPLAKPILCGDQNISTTTQQSSVRPEDATMRTFMEDETILKSAESLSWMNPDNSAERGPAVESQDQVGLSWLQNCFRTTLKFDPKQRNLADAISHLNYDKLFQLPENYPTPSPIQDAVNTQFQAAARNSMPMSWIAMRYLDPFTRDAIMKHRFARQAIEDPMTTANSGLFLGTAACLISGMGSDNYQKPDYDDDALDAIAIACRRENKSAAAIIFRMYNAFQKDIPTDIDYITKLQDAAIYGSDAAYEDLKLVGAELTQSVKFSKLHQSCGVGASFFWDANCLNGWSFSNYKANLGWIKLKLESSGSEPWNIKVNERGDSFLHAAVSLSIEGLVPILLDKYKFPLDLENDVGETPLLCAMRNGRVDFVYDLIHRGANVNHISRRGETPMHWVISLADVVVQSMVAKLMGAGAAPTLNVWAERCDYAGVGLPSYIQYAERLSAGNPLHWAVCRKKAYLVRTLMEHGAKVDVHGSAVEYFTPMEQAAYLHEADLLRLMIQKNFPRPRKSHASHIGDRAAISQVIEEEANHTILHGLREMVKAAIDGSDRYSLLVRHGDRYKSFMRRTFQLLGEETKFASFPEGVDQDAHTILHYAAMHGFEESVTLIMTHMNGAVDINTRHGHSGNTPICEAIRRNHKSMFYFLISMGADLSIPVDDPKLQGHFYWGLLHIAAQHVLSNDLEIAEYLIAQGLKLDGYGTATDPAESPLAIAVDNNQLAFATLIRQANANIDATSKYVLQGRHTLKCQTTILGRSIIANMRHSHYKLKYLLYPTTELQELDQPSFIVVPQFGITALHASLLADDLLEEPFERDAESEDNIFSFLCERFDSPEEINQLYPGTGETALHIAVRKENVYAVQTLVNDYGAAVDITDGRGMTAGDLAAVQLAVLLDRDTVPEDQIERLAQIVELVGPSVSDDGQLSISTELLRQLQIRPATDATNPLWTGPTGNKTLGITFNLTNVKLFIANSWDMSPNTSLRIDVASSLPFTLQQLPPYELSGTGFACRTNLGLAMHLIVRESRLSSLGDRKTELMWSIMETIDRSIDPAPQTNARKYWTVKASGSKEPQFNWNQFLVMVTNFLHNDGHVFPLRFTRNERQVAESPNQTEIDLRVQSTDRDVQSTLQMLDGVTEIARIERDNRWLVCVKFGNLSHSVGQDTFLQWFSFPFSERDSRQTVPVDETI